MKDDLLTHLPPGLVARHYELSFIPELQSSDPSISSFSGAARITLDTTSDQISYISLHVDSLNITRISGTVSQAFSSQEIIFKGVVFDFQKSMVHLVSNSYFNIGEPSKLNFSQLQSVEGTISLGSIRRNALATQRDSAGSPSWP